MKSVDYIKESVKIIPFSFIVATAIFFIVSLDVRSIPLKTYMSYMAIIFVVISLIFFFYGQIIKDKGDNKKISLLDRALSLFVSIVYAGAIGVLMIVFTYLVVQAYPEAYVLRYAGAIGAGALAAFATYNAISESLKAESLTVTKYLATFMFGGLLLSAVAQTDPYWYVESFSYLGMNPTLSGKIFNFTMIVSGLGTIALAKYILDEIKTSDVGRDITPKSLKIDKALLVIMGVGILFVGLIPYAEGIQGSIHTLAACLSGVAFLILCIFSKKLLPAMSKYFYNFSYFLALVTILTSLSFLLGQAELATVEIIVFIAVFVWVYFMLQVMRFSEKS